MVLDIDIYHTANILVREHGQDAPIHAAMRADELLERLLPFPDLVARGERYRLYDS